MEQIEHKKPVLIRVDHGNIDAPIELLVYQKETYNFFSDSRQLKNAEIEVVSQIVSPLDLAKKRVVTHFSGGFDSASNRVSLTSNTLASEGGVFLEPTEIQGNHIGTYLMERIVSWAKQWPKGEIVTVNVPTKDDWSMNRDRRIRFYHQFNIPIFLEDELEIVSSGDAKIASDLIIPSPEDSWGKSIAEVELSEYIIEQKKMMVALEAQNNRLKKSNEYMLGNLKDIKGRPIRWALSFSLKTNPIYLQAFFIFLAATCVGFITQ